MQELPPLAPQHLVPLALTIEEAGLVSRVGRNSLYAAIQTGALRARKLGKKILILTDDLRAWLESLPVASSGDSSNGTPRAPAETAAAPSPKRRLIAAE